VTREWEEATRAGDLRHVEALLDSGTAIDALDRHGQTALMNAAHRGNERLVRLLVERGAELNQSAKYGLMALTLAIVAGHAEVVRLLLTAGADATKKCSLYPDEELTADQLATRLARTEIVEIINAGARD
jgi:ankyrin repeat protein